MPPPESGPRRVVTSMPGAGGWDGEPPPPRAGETLQPELADVARFGRRLVHLAVRFARSEDSPVRRLLGAHLGPEAASMTVVSRSWQPYDHVNVQVGLDAWLDSPGRQHELAGLAGLHPRLGLADLMHSGGRGAAVGNVFTVALPAGPGGRTRSCVVCGLYLIAENGVPYALLLQAGRPDQIIVEVAGPDTGRAEQMLAELRQLTLERNVYRGQVVAFGGEMFGPGRSGALRFLDRPQTAREQVVLPEDLLAGIDRQVVGVQKHVARLLASGQHLKRGVLLYGPPGTGKTHTVGYLIGQMPEATVVLLSGRALELISQACSVARLLQPSLIVVEDVDLIAEQRGRHPGQHPLLFQLLNEMDGLGEDVNVTFLLTTNRADMLEPALAERPGRVDHAVELPLPDENARRTLIGLYRGSLVLDLDDDTEVITRTEGVTASFLKELLRKSALLAAEDASAAAPDGPLRVTGAHLSAALDQLLDTRNKLTRVLLGGQAAGGPARPR